MQATQLTAVDKQTGKTVLLAAREVPLVEQIALREKITPELGQKYSRIDLDYLSPCKTPLKFKSPIPVATKAAVASSVPLESKESAKESAHSADATPEAKPAESNKPKKGSVFGLFK